MKLSNHKCQQSPFFHGLTHLQDIIFVDSACRERDGSSSEEEEEEEESPPFLSHLRYGERTENVEGPAVHWSHRDHVRCAGAVQITLSNT